MEEILELKNYLLDGNLEGALEIAIYLEEMGKDDKISTITSFCIVLLTHLIKRQAEHRTTRSWNVSIDGSTWEIHRRNKRRKSGGYYLNEQELTDCLKDAYASAIKKAALEINEGEYTAKELAALMEPRDRLIQEALTLILDARNLT